MANDKAQLKRLVRGFHATLSGDSKAQSRVKSVNTLLNSGYNLKLLDDCDIDQIWESLFFALWYAEMGRGCEEIIAAIERACSSNYRLTRIGFQTIAKKWYGLDQYRVDKVSHLARHLLPVLLNHQVKLWFKSYKKSKSLGARDIPCKKLLKRTLIDVSKSYGLCYFLLEILAEEISKTLTRTYERLCIITSRYELKANLIIFLYKQVIIYASTTQLDARLLRTFDQYVVKRFIEQILPNESQLTQILVSLRFYQALDSSKKKLNSPTSGKCRALLERWSDIIRDTHEKSINGEFFPIAIVPLRGTIQLKPHITDAKIKNEDKS